MDAFKKYIIVTTAFFAAFLFVAASPDDALADPKANISEAHLKALQAKFQAAAGTGPSATKNWRTKSQNLKPYPTSNNNYTTYDDSDSDSEPIPYPDLGDEGENEGKGDQKGEPMGKGKHVPAGGNDGQKSPSTGRGGDPLPMPGSGPIHHEGGPIVITGNPGMGG